MTLATEQPQDATPKPKKQDATPKPKKWARPYQADVPREVLKAWEFGKAVGLGRDAVYARIRSGDIATIRHGARIFIPRSEVAAYIAAQTRQK
jgi:hypothetical protein